MALSSMRFDARLKVRAVAALRMRQGNDSRSSARRGRFALPL